MEIVRVSIFERGMNDTFWPEVVLIIIYIKSLYSMQALKGLTSLNEIQDKNLSNKNLSNKNLLNLYHIRIFGLMVYVFPHKEKRILKSVK